MNFIMNKLPNSKGFLILIFFYFSNCNYAQEIFMGEELPSLEIKSLLNFKDLSSIEWKNEMKKYFSNAPVISPASKYYETCPNGTSFTEQLGPDKVIQVDWTRCPDGKLWIVFADLFNLTTNSYLGGIIDKLEKFYVKTENKLTYYRLNTDKYYYVFIISLNNGSEMMTISRFDL